MLTRKTALSGTLLAVHCVAQTFCLTNALSTCFRPLSAEFLVRTQWQFDTPFELRTQPDTGDGVLGVCSDDLGGPHFSP